MPYQCDTEGDESPASLLITNLDSGDTVALCAQCVHPWMQAMATATEPEPEPAEPEPSISHRSGWDGPAALDVYPEGDPRNEPDHPDNVIGQNGKQPPRKRAPRKAAAQSV